MVTTNSPSPRPRRRWRLALLAIGIGLAAVLALSCAMPSSLRRRQERFARSPNWKDGHFQNPVPTEVMRSGKSSSMWDFLFGGKDRVPAKPLPMVPMDLAALGPAPADSVRATWLGHSTVWLEIEGRRVLTDPVWSSRSSPVGFAGPKRFQPPPIALEALPVPDVVVISHDHYDHLDCDTIQALAKRGARFVVPLGVGARLEDWGVPLERIQELDWWEEAEIVPGELKLVAMPSRHFSGRGAFDRNRTQWAAWAIIGRSKRVLFGGDGGLWDGIGELARRQGPFDLAMLEIGAWNEAWGDIHMGPANALEADRALGSPVVLPIHWATFNLALHPWYEPAEDLYEAGRKAGLRIAFPRIGETFRIDQPLPERPWWRQAGR
jgi:L-ascorbate metabolism protein UlaG (beta-lactamase superfamily)